MANSMANSMTNPIAGDIHKAAGVCVSLRGAYACPPEPAAKGGLHPRDSSSLVASRRSHVLGL